MRHASLDSEERAAEAAETADYTFVLRLDDRPGAMELVAATFAHRGISITATLGNDGAMDPAGHAVVLVHFHTTVARKEALRRTMTRLSRVRSLAEYAPDSPDLRRCALVRCRAGVGLPSFPEAAQGTVEEVSRDASTGEVTFALMGRAADVLRIIGEMRDGGSLVAVSHAVLAV